MKHSLRVKLVGLAGVAVALVISSGCMGGGGKDTAAEYGAVCGGFTRTCQDGSPAVKQDAQGCQQTCPEDKEILDKLGGLASGSGTGTGTGTGSSTATATTVTCASDSYGCPDGSQVKRDPSNGCQFRACPQ